MKKSEFEQYATLGRGINSQTLGDYRAAVSAYINPTIIEERPLNVASMDVFSRLMMDRIIFLGVGINDDVANIIIAQLLFHAFLGSLTSLCRTVSCSEAFLTQLQVDRNRRVVECLIICVTENEGYVVDTFTVHVINGVTATATYTDDLDDAILLV